MLKMRGLHILLFLKCFLYHGMAKNVIHVLNVKKTEEPTMSHAVKHENIYAQSRLNPKVVCFSGMYLKGTCNILQFLSNRSQTFRAFTSLMSSAAFTLCDDHCK